MRNSLLIAAALAFVAGGAIAQTPPAKDGPQNSAVNSQNSSNRMVDAPVKGSNSFTEGEAKSRIEKMGFANVSDLKKDEHGVWRGQAMKNGQAQGGNIFSTDPSIAENSFVVLDDPKGLFGVDNVVPLIAKAKVTPTISAALNAVSAKLDTSTLGELLKQVVTDKKDPAVVAKEFLTENGLG